tara:strand:- start:209 stop:601 length:393 start_codon:yes stop_codon:yes gene_type:complete
LADRRKKGRPLDQQKTLDMVRTRAADIRMIVMSFTISHAALLIVLGFGADGLSDSGIQLSLATFIVLGSVWCLAFMDDGMQDMMAGLSDLDGFEASAMGQRLAKQPIVIFRVVNVVFVGLIVAAELMAIY